MCVCKYQVAAATQAPSGHATIPILAYDQIALLFEQLESTVALNHNPQRLTSEQQIVDHTLAYYEHEMGTGQDQLILVYALRVEFTPEEGYVTTSSVYVPAIPEFMAPMAAFAYTAGMPVSHTVGIREVFEFKAADAELTLAEMGFDRSLDFAFGSGGPYLYEWYLK